ncbi:serine hydrolase [Pseudomonas sp. TH31]|uniref:serine hydrolase n=1 Tax=Pseudomonas sp. TH31 TaxID=2796396 RepID=UPI001912D16E|nr:D-alanyl-D-alanine carboxypeptidase [Pseudomonas sp. TH31]
MKSILTLFCYITFVASPWASAALRAPPPPSIEARSYILVDVDSGQILAARDPNVRVEPASTTKLMTAYLVFQALKENRIALDQRIAVSDTVWRKPGSSMYIDTRMQVPVDDLIKGMLVQSGNDATNLLAETLGGTTDGFVSTMNAQARLLGMSSTTFKNPEGLPTPGHLTTAHDLAIMGVRVLQDFPEYSHYFSIKHYYYPGTPSSNGTNRNRLLFRDSSVEGLKTGHTDAAGYCLVASATKSFGHYGKRRIVAVVLGAASDRKRADETQKLLNWGFRAYSAVRLDIEGSTYETMKIWKGEKGFIKLGIAPSAVAVPAGSEANIETQFDIPQPLSAPIAMGQQVGLMKVSLDGQLLREIPVTALEEIKEANFLVRFWDSLVLLFKSLF